MKRLIWVLVFTVLLSGCAVFQRKPVSRAVTGIQVEYSQSGSTIHRTYTGQKSMQSVLTYIRLLRPFGPVIPDESEDFTCRITLQYSHGPDSTYFQQGSGYLQIDNGEWKAIDKTNGQLIYPLLLLLPSDTG